LLLGDVRVVAGYRHIVDKARQHGRLTHESRLGRVRDIKYHQTWSEADVGIVPLEGYSLYRAPDLGNELNVLALLGPHPRPLSRFRERGVWRRWRPGSHDPGQGEGQAGDENECDTASCCHGSIPFCCG